MELILFVIILIPGMLSFNLLMAHKEEFNIYVKLHGSTQHLD